jgi:hypothetical protein
MVCHGKTTDNFKLKKISQFPYSTICLNNTIINFYSAIAFWDEKHPLKSSVLNCLNLAMLADWEFVTAEDTENTEGDKREMNNSDANKFDIMNLNTFSIFDSTVLRTID